MMGFKERAFAPLVSVSLEELVPQDHFYRHLQQILDLSFVHQLVREHYAIAGRPSIDPVVFFKLQLVMFFENIRSERLLMRQVADRLSLRWYIGYDLDEPLPDHSTLSKIRQRYGLDVFRRFFEAIVQRCQEAKLVWGKELCAIRSLETVCSLIRGISGFVPKGTLITTRLMLGAIPNLLGESRQRSPYGSDWPSIRKAGENEDKR